ncbi:MAG: hypothetical protein H6908_02775 [Hyphomicrobiales bacterium]|nr:hypothetical protein [Hyphomicrobiales bacterium]
MFGAYFRIVLGSIIAFAVVAGLLAAGFVALVIGAVIIGGLLIWIRIRQAMGKSPTPHARKKQVIEAEYVIVEEDLKEK